MDRQDFMDIVYAELADDPDNNRANRIIWAADGYAKSAQLGTNLAEVGTDCISRQKAIDEIDEWIKAFRENGHKESAADACLIQDGIMQLPPAQPETATVTIGRTKGGVTMWYECDACGEPVDQKDNYCRNCGRKLKHE